VRIENPAAGKILAAGRYEISDCGEFLEYPEYDRADKGKGDIRGNNAQSIDQSHANLLVCVIFCVF
jgi:hypothetical protein